MLQELKDFESRHFAFFFLFALGSICPGALVIARFFPNWMESLETIKFIVLSISLTLPFVAVNAFSMVVADILESKPKRDHEMVFFGVFLAGTIGTICVFYPSLLLAYLFESTFRGFFVFLLIAEVVIFITLVIGERSSIRSEKGADS